MRRRHSAEGVGGAALPTGGVRRVHIVGGPGSGKTSLATWLASRTDLPVFHLDEVARIGGGNGPLRDPAERDALVEDIVRQPYWIAEGVHLGWTEPLMSSADLLIWLDYISWRRASRRILSRFLQGALREARLQRGTRRIARFRDYGRHLRALGGAIVETRQHYRRGGSDGAGRTLTETEAAMESHVAPHRAKLVHCRTAGDVDRLVAALSRLERTRPEREPPAPPGPGLDRP